MKINKKSISVLLSGMLISGMLVGCSSEFDSTEYLDEDGKKLIEKYEDREKYDYVKVESLEPFTSEDMYKDKYIMITGKVTSISEEGLACYELGFDFEENHTANIIRVFVLKNTIDVKFKKGDIITVYGKCNGIKTKRYDDKSIDYWHINANFLELGDTTNEEKSTKKDDVEAKATEDKEVETTKDKSEEKEVAKDKEEEKSSSQDNNKSNEKQIDTKKDNDNSTKKKPVTKEESKEKPIYDEYGYDQYGNYNPNKDLHNDREWNNDDHKRWEEAHGEDCSICGGHVGGKEMCECDGTIHHRTCHIDAYTCPSCNRYGLKHNPDIYGCPYCGYSNEVEEYDSEEPIQEADDYYE